VAVERSLVLGLERRIPVAAVVAERRILVEVVAQVHLLWSAVARLEQFGQGPEVVVPLVHHILAALAVEDVALLVLHSLPLVHLNSPILGLELDLVEYPQFGHLLHRLLVHSPEELDRTVAAEGPDHILAVEELDHTPVVEEHTAVEAQIGAARLAGAEVLGHILHFLPAVHSSALGSRILAVLTLRLGLVGVPVIHTHPVPVHKSLDSVTMV